VTGFFTDYARDILLDIFFGYPFHSRPPTLYVGLAQNSSNRQGLVTEPLDGGYARVPLKDRAVGFSEVDAGEKSNSLPIVFPTPLSDWGLIQSVFIADAFTEGNILAMADLPTPQAINSRRRTPTIAPGHLQLKLL
jgi:hypothetical protein